MGGDEVVMGVVPARHVSHIPQKEGRGVCCGRWRVIFMGIAALNGDGGGG